MVRVKLARAWVWGVVGVALCICASALGGPVAAVEGTWRGQLGALHLVVTFTRAADGQRAGVLDSVDQGARLAIDIVSVTSTTVHFEVARVGGVYDGVLENGAARLRGTWTQTGAPVQTLVFDRDADGATTSAPASSQREPLRASPLDVQIPRAPVAFPAHGGRHLVYELHITNMAPKEVVLTDVEAQDESGESLWRSAGADLQTRIARPGLPDATGEGALHVPAGTRAVVFAWVTRDATASLPRRLVHRIGGKSADGSIRFMTTISPVEVGAAMLRLGPPLRGSGWRAANGPADRSQHRRALMPVDGRAHIAQRFAIDWVKEGADGKTFRGDQKSNASYLAYGADVLAVADGKIVEVKDGLPENPPSGLALPTTIDTIAGNHILLDLGGGRRALYAHLKPGSLRVKLGDVVKRGQVIALLGNTGNSTEPHLHFQVAEGDSPLGAEGVPYLLERYFTRTNAKGRREAHTNELPMENDLIDFQ
jgi:murein DD-endopeptidase MepM/ murein hydrolase activator NlpD